MGVSRVSCGFLADETPIHAGMSDNNFITEIIGIILYFTIAS